jgi:hypothetical protein
MDNNTIDWLLEGDVSLQYQTRKYLIHEPNEEINHLRKRIALEGWGKAFLDARNPSGHWGRDFYQVKWISSHYTLLDLRYLEIEPTGPILETLQLILNRCKSADGSINESHSTKSGDVCVNGMFLNYASFFGMPETALKSIVDYLLDNVMPDGGFNCDANFKGAVHSSMHTTISVLEGIWEYLKAGHPYRAGELEKARKDAEAFLLMHQLFKSDHTGEIIDKRWTMLSFPSRWRYDVLRALVYFAHAGAPYDSNMGDAVDLLVSKRRRDGTWPVQLKHPGLVHFDMEMAGGSSRFNTLRALRVLSAFGLEEGTWR